jgi:hypothetical protein
MRKRLDQRWPLISWMVASLQLCSYRSGCWYVCLQLLIWLRGTPTHCLCTCQPGAAEHLAHLISMKEGGPDEPAPLAGLQPVYTAHAVRAHSGASADNSASSIRMHTGQPYDSYITDVLMYVLWLLLLPCTDNSLP